MSRYYYYSFRSNTIIVDTVSKWIPKHGYDGGGSLSSSSIIRRQDLRTVPYHSQMKILEEHFTTTVTSYDSPHQQNRRQFHQSFVTDNRQQSQLQQQHRYCGNDRINYYRHLHKFNNSNYSYNYDPSCRYMSRTSSSSKAYRSRRRQLRSHRHQTQTNKPSTSRIGNVTDPNKDDEDDDGGDNNKTDENSLVEKLPPYPPGKPWRVLFFRPHGDPTTMHHGAENDGPNSSGGGRLGRLTNTIQRYYRKIPSLNDWRHAYVKYMETWEGGIQGKNSTQKQEQSVDGHNDGDDRKTGTSDNSTNPSLDDITTNATRNIKLVREDAQTLLQTTKDQTGIHTLDDMKKVAAEMMQLATQCIKEFMAGYRQGRDDEIDKMLHQYFQEQQQQSPDGDSEQATSESSSQRRRKKRKTKRLIRDFR